MFSNKKFKIHCADRFSSSNDPLLNEEHASTDSERGRIVGRSDRSFWPFAVHILVLITYSVVFLIALSNLRSTPRLTYTPVNNNIPLHVSSYDDEAPNDFRGKPRPELDQAWHDLLLPANIRLSESELRRLNRTAISLQDGSGYYGAINVYHHLHCLKTVRQVLHNDYYQTGITADDHHLDHCIDAIRLALMCNPDIGMTTYDWRSDHRKPKPNPHIHRTCTNWDALAEWSSRRSFDTFDQKSLVHPEFGIMYPLIDGDYELVSSGPNMHVVWPEGYAAESH